MTVADQNTFDKNKNVTSSSTNHLHTALRVCAIGALICITATISAAKQLADLHVYPPQVNLQTAADAQSLVVVATFDDGTTQDVTQQCGYLFADDALAKLDANDANKVHPLKDGNTQLTVSFQERSVAVPVSVKDAATARPISFKLDVMPVFMRAGCNSGSCHGSARGRDGFRLSLFGFDPDGDYYRLTRQMSSRRLNLALTEHSMMIEKALGRVPHSGGKRFEHDSEYFQTLTQWLEAGAPKDGDDIAAPVNIEILPKQIVLEGRDTQQQMTVRARYSDDTDRDVTFWIHISH